MKRLFIILCIFTIAFVFIYPPYSCPGEFKNSIGMNMALIGEGDFVMGDQNKMGGPDEKPAHRVDIKPFFLSDTEITVAQWKAFFDDSDTEWDRWKDVEKYSTGQDYPVVFVSWQDAVEFCEWLSEKEGKEYRLPTEAEWEYAARGGLQGKLYPWGDGPPDGSRCNFADRNEYLKEKDIWAEETKIDDGFAYCAKAKHYNPNNYGLYQMSGNVLEWCHDWYNSNYYKESGSENPGGPSSGKVRVLRGGAWCFPPPMLRVSKRYGLSPKIRKEFIGFRVALEYEQVLN